MRRCAGLALLGILAAPSAAATRPIVGRPFRDVPFAPEMVVVPAGQGVMGSDEAETARERRTPALAAFEHPQRAITIPRPFAIATHHVTMREFAMFARATKRDMAGCVVLRDAAWSKAPDPAYSFAHPGWTPRDDEPVVCVNWDDANAYAAWLGMKTHAAYRLATEREWEYAARAGATTARWWGDTRDDLCRRANGGDRAYAAILPSDTTANLTCNDGYAHTSPVDRYPANRWGLHDMYGNAWQWTADCYAPVPGAASAPPCTARSIRGGSWHSSAATLRSATRFSLPPTTRASSLGFRVVRDIDTARGDTR